MKKNISNKMVAHFLAFQKKKGEWSLPLVEAARLHRQQRRCVLYALLSLVTAFAGLALQMLSVRGDWGTRTTEIWFCWILIVSIASLPFFTFRYLYKMTRVTNITEDNSSAGNLLEAVKAFEREFGRSPHRLGPVGAGKAMVMMAKKVLRQEKKGKDAYELRKALGRQYDAAKVLMPVPVGGLGPIFTAAKGEKV